MSRTFRVDSETAHLPPRARSGWSCRVRRHAARRATTSEQCWLSMVFFPWCPAIELGGAKSKCRRSPARPGLQDGRMMATL
eukprot:1601787-Prymnesium_polylepis.1